MAMNTGPYHKPKKPFVGRDLRQAKRVATNKPAVLHVQGREVPVRLSDLSVSGAQIQLHENRAAMQLDCAISLAIPGIARVPLDIRWRDQTQIGVAFDAPGPQKALLAQQIKRKFASALR